MLCIPTDTLLLLRTLTVAISTAVYHKVVVIRQPLSRQLSCGILPGQFAASYALTEPWYSIA